jgi:hypothetical protein
MSVDLARVQFAFISINHFFVPVTIGLAFLTAPLQTAAGANSCRIGTKRSARRRRPGATPEAIRLGEMTCPIMLTRW